MRQASCEASKECRQRKMRIALCDARMSVQFCVTFVCKTGFCGMTEHTSANATHSQAVRKQEV